MSQIHGHTLMQWLAEAPQPLAFAELEARVIGAFGREARFCTCDSEGHTLAELLALLEARGKVWQQGGGYVSELQRMCTHEA